MTLLQSKNKNKEKDFSNFRHPFLFLVTEVSSQAWRRSPISPGIPDIPPDDLYFVRGFAWIPLRGLTTVGVENGTIIGRIDDVGRIRAIYNNDYRVINIRLLGHQRIVLSVEEVRRLAFGRKFRQTMLVNFVEQPNAHN